MKKVVLKFGGKTISDIDKIKKVSEYIKKRVNDGDKIVVVVSAMGDETDRLIELAAKIDGCSYKRELDVLLSTGEIKSAALLTMTLLFKDVKAKSLNYINLGIKTNDEFSNAKIIEVDASNINKILEEGCVAVVPGYQGITEYRDVTTLGRGGSDTTAVAIASEISADECILFKDVGAVYTFDPKTYEHYEKLDTVDYDTMLEMADNGARIICKESLLIAKEKDVNLLIASPDTFLIGTKIKEKI